MQLYEATCICPQLVKAMLVLVRISSLLLLAILILRHDLQELLNQLRSHFACNDA